MKTKGFIPASVQHLKRMLKEIIDASTKIVQSFENECLRFSFQGYICNVALILPKEFRNSGFGLEIVSVIYRKLIIQNG